MIRHQKENTYEISRTQERSQREKKNHQRSQDCYGNIKSAIHTAEKNRTEKGEQNKMYILKIFIGLERKGNGTPLQYFCLKNPMDGGAW